MAAAGNDATGSFMALFDGLDPSQIRIKSDGNSARRLVFSSRLSSLGLQRIPAKMLAAYNNIVSLSSGRVATFSIQITSGALKPVFSRGQIVFNTPTLTMDLTSETPQRKVDVPIARYYELLQEYEPSTQFITDIYEITGQAETFQSCWSVLDRYRGVSEEHDAELILKSPQMLQLMMEIWPDKYQRYLRTVYLTVTPLEQFRLWCLIAYLSSQPASIQVDNPYQEMPSLERLVKL